MSHLWPILAGLVVLVVVHRLKPDPLHDIPGPWLAKYTCLLLAYHTRTGKRYLYVDTLHKQYGPFVRITPNQVSCASPTAPNIIYAQGSASLPKTPFYRAFYVDGSPSLFSTQDRAGHASKRRVLAHPFSYASVKQFEGWIRKSLVKMVKGLDARAGGLGVNAETPGRAQGSTPNTDVLMWLNYMTFDVISDLAFGESLGMLDRASDVLVSPQDTVHPKNAPGVAAMIDYRGRTAAFLGLFPFMLPGSLLAGIARWIPDQFVQRGLQGTQTLSYIAQRCVKRRVEDAGMTRRGDLLDRLLEDMRNKQGSEEDVSEADVVTDAMLLLTAGSDTTANSTAAILYWIYRSPRVLSTLRAELLSALASQPSAILPPSTDFDDLDIQVDDDTTTIPYHDQLKGCKYLQATIDEGLRMFATNAFGLPRMVPEGASVTIEGRTFYENTELSAPAYTIQHDPTVWGDPNVFRPERWLDSPGGGELSTQASELKKYLLTFGMGPRACIGKNLAYLQMQLLVATVVLRYDLSLRDGELKSVEGFMHKPVDLWAKVALRKEDGEETAKT